jgi:hypothetical protein
MDPAMSPPGDGPSPDSERLLISVTSNGGATQRLYEFPRRTPRVQVEHDPEQRIFRVAQSDGTTSVFRDEPVRFLVAVRNPKTGEASPMLRYGELEYLYLCRKERERASERHDA